MTRWFIDHMLVYVGAALGSAVLFLACTDVYSAWTTLTFADRWSPAVALLDMPPLHENIIIKIRPLPPVGDMPSQDKIEHCVGSVLGMDLPPNHNHLFCWSL